MIGECRQHNFDRERITSNLKNSTIEECQLKCKDTPKCNFFTYSKIPLNCSFYTKASNICEGYLGLRNSLLRKCKKGAKFLIYFIAYVKLNGMVISATL